MPSANSFFTAAEQQEIIRAIGHAEDVTSGEIRVHIEETCGDNALDRAAAVFKKLNMHDTTERNGVLIYLAIKEKQFAIIGDEGIHTKVPANFWDNVKNGMEAEFSKGRFLYGIIQAVEQAGEQLKIFFPIASSDKNELSDELSFGNE